MEYEKNKGPKKTKRYKRWNPRNLCWLTVSPSYCLITTTHKLDTFPPYISLYCIHALLFYFFKLKKINIKLIKTQYIKIYISFICKK